MKTVAWLVDDEKPHARVVRGEGWPGGNYAEALVGMIDAQNAIHAAVAAERERCAKVCEGLGAMEALDGEGVGSAAMVRVADRMSELCAAAIREA